MLLHFTNRDKVKEDELEESLFSLNVTKAIRESLLPTMTEEKFDEIIVSLREKEILLDKKVNPKLVRFYPKIKDTEIGYKIILEF